MSVNWLLERDTFNEGNPERMIDIIKSRGIAVKVVGYIPFGGGVQDKETTKVHSYDKISDLFSPHDCVVAYGSINLIRGLLRGTPWTPTAWMNLKDMTCQSYYAHWGHFCLQREYAMVPWADLPRVKDKLYQTYQEDDCVFFRPNDNTKVFTGKVVPREEFKRWYDQEEYCYSPAPESLAVVARPQKLDAEWRIVICDGKIVTGSLYKTNGRTMTYEEMEPGAPKEALDLAETIARLEWKPGPAFVLDVCLSVGEYKVLEIGSLNSAGLYKCDLEKVVDAMSALAIKEWKEINNDD